MPLQLKLTRRFYCVSIVAIFVTFVLSLHLLWLVPYSVSRKATSLHLKSQELPATSALLATAAMTKAIVVGTIGDMNIAWLQTNFPTWQHFVYHVHDNAAANDLRTKNRGREGSAYLTYIIDNYENLHDIVVFSHDQRYAWHNDDPMYDGAHVLSRLNLSRVEEEGYINLRCVWSPGCGDADVIRPTLEWTYVGKIGWMTLYGRAFHKLFPEKPLPETVRNQCCAQFAVAKSRILARPKNDYVRYRDFLWGWHFADYAPEVTEVIVQKLDTSAEWFENTISGNIMENMWHMIFGREAGNCLPAGECYCKNFGLCELRCPSESFCRGHYYKPPGNHTMPEGWPERGQGEGGWPLYNWWLLDV